MRNDLYFVWKANGDFVLTSTLPTLQAIPEPSTATLSLLVLAGLLRRPEESKSQSSK